LQYLRKDSVAKSLQADIWRAGLATPPKRRLTRANEPIDVIQAWGPPPTGRGDNYDASPSSANRPTGHEYRPSRYRTHASGGGECPPDCGAGTPMRLADRRQPEPGSHG